MVFKFTKGSVACKHNLDTPRSHVAAVSEDRRLSNVPRMSILVSNLLSYSSSKGFLAPSHSQRADCPPQPAQSSARLPSQSSKPRPPDQRDMSAS